MYNRLVDNSVGPPYPFTMGGCMQARHPSAWVGISTLQRVTLFFKIRPPKDRHLPISSPDCSSVGIPSRADCGRSYHVLVVHSHALVETRLLLYMIQSPPFDSGINSAKHASSSSLGFLYSVYEDLKYTKALHVSSSFERFIAK